MVGRGRRKLRKINKIIIHCSDSDNPRHDNIDTIRAWHMQRGWIDVGYHYIITWDGKVYPGRPIHQIGAHCKGHNVDSIGICLTGKWRFSNDQLLSLNELTTKLCVTNFVDESKVYPHNYFNKNKSCPNFELDDFYWGCFHES